MVIIGVIMIKKKFTAIGNSWGIIIPKAILEGLSINPVIDEVALKIDNNTIKIEKLSANDKKV